jgi:MFS family permease
VRAYRRNWWAFFADHVFFGLALIFGSTTTILPAFAATLTDNKVLIGAVSAVWTGGWLLPQVFAAPYVSHYPRKYPIMMIGQVVGRPIYPLFALWVLAGGTRFPELTLALMLVMLAVFVVFDAVIALAWFDLLAKALTPATRGRLLGWSQVASGVLAIGAGALIRWLLGPDGPAYPLNYGIILLLASACFAGSLIGCWFIVEPPEATEENRPTFRQYLPQLARLWRADRAFSLVTAVRLLAGAGAVATTFYVVFATDVLRLPPAAIGLFAGATTVGSALAGLVLGPVADRAGSHRVIQAATGMAFLVPVIALFCRSGLLGSSVSIVYPALYVLLGMFEGSVLLGFFNFVLEIAPAGQRPVYIGLTNTVVGLLFIMPVLGGWVLQATSYTVLFALAAGATLAGALLALRLPNPRAAGLGDAVAAEPLGGPGAEG